MSRTAGIKRFAFFWAAALVAAAGVASCRGPERTELRLGYLPNLTHAVPMVGAERGMFTVSTGRKVVLVRFNAGPTAIEALLAGDVDLVYCGPGPAINAFIRTDGRVRVVAGAASGGASLVVRSALTIDDPADLKRRRLATPQIGNTQDIALRKFLWENDLNTQDRGGSVTVLTMSNADILSMMRAKEIDGAWVPEPWASRLVEEAGGRIFIDESTLWPGGKFPTTLLVATQHALEHKRAEVADIAQANRRIVAWINANPNAARAMVNARLKRETGKSLADPVLRTAWKRLTFLEDPLMPGLRADARAARRIGYLPHSDIRGILVERWELEEPRSAEARPE